MVEVVGQTDTKTTEVYAQPKKTIQVWKTLLNWLSFFFQIFVQIIRAATPSLINYYSSSSSPSFDPLPVVELPESQQPPSPASAAVRISSAGAEFDPSQKLIIVLDLDETLVCAYETSSLPSIVRNQAIEAGLKWFELECVSSDKATEILEKEGINAEVINLRSLRPLDRATINASVRKTNRLVTVEEGFRQHGVGAEICATVVEDSFGYLDAPVERIAGAYVPTPYAANLERLAFPQIEDIVGAAKRSCYRSVTTAATA